MFLSEMNAKLCDTHRLRRSAVCGTALPETPTESIDEPDTTRLVTEPRSPQYRPVAEHPNVVKIFHRVQVHQCVSHFVVGARRRHKSHHATQHTTSTRNHCTAVSCLRSIFYAHASYLTWPHLQKRHH